MLGVKVHVVPFSESNILPFHWDFNLWYTGTCHCLPFISSSFSERVPNAYFTIELSVVAQNCIYVRCYTEDLYSVNQ